MSQEGIPQAESMPDGGCVSPAGSPVGWGGDLLGRMVLLAAFVLLFYPVLFEGKTFFFRDILQFAYPMKHFIWRSFHQGALPLWWPEIYGGIPFLALLQPGVFYPPILFFLLDDFNNAFSLFFLFHHLVLVFSLYALVRHWGYSVYAALGAGVMGLFGGFFLSLASIHNHFQSAVWLPLILLCFHRYLQSGKLVPFLATVFFMACQATGGSPEFCLLSSAILLCYGVWGVPVTHGVHGMFRRTGAFVAVVVLALGLSAAQLAPTYKAMAEMERGQGLNFEDSASWSIAPGSLLQLLVARDYRAYLEVDTVGMNFFLPSLYMGLLATVFMIWAALSFRDRLSRFWLLWFLAGIFFGLGEYNPAYRWFYESVPFFKLFRYPEKFFFLSAFALVFMAARGIEEFGAGPPACSGQRRGIWIAMGLVGAGIVAVAVGGQASRLWTPALVWLMFAVIAIAYSRALLNGHATRILIVLILAADLLVNGIQLLPLIDRKFYEEPPLPMERIVSDAGPFRVFSGALTSPEPLATKNRFPDAPTHLFRHLAVKERVYPNLASIFGLEFPDGLTGLRLRDPVMWSSILSHSPPEKRMRILKRSNVRFWVTPEFAEPPAPDLPLGISRVETIGDALPRAFWVPRARLGREPLLVNTYFSESFDPRAEVLVGEPVAPVPGGDSSGRVVRLAYAPNRVTVETEQNGFGFLVLLDRYDPGWSAEVDGEPARTLRANHFFRAVPLPAGHHVVEWRYVPLGYPAGLFISLMTFVLIFLLSVIGDFRKRCFSSGTGKGSPA